MEASRGQKGSKEKSKKNEDIRGEWKKNRRQCIIKRRKKDGSRTERREKEMKEIEKRKASRICYQLIRFSTLYKAEC